MEVKVTVLEYPTERDWMEVKRRALVTIGKKPLTPPSDEWKKAILKARHSPIRYLRFSFLLDGVPSWVATHLARHVHAQPYIKSQRNDRQTDYDRNAARQDAPVSMIWDMGGEELLIVANKRLCKQAAEETREIVHAICMEVRKVCPEFSDELVPMCGYTGICKEMHPCYVGKEE